MANFVRLTNTDGKAVLVNLDNVCYFEDMDDSTFIQFNNEYTVNLRVNECVEELENFQKIRVYGNSK